MFIVTILIWLALTATHACIRWVIRRKSQLIYIKKVNPLATVPTKGSRFAAGYDCYACCEELIVLKAGERALFKLGIAMRAPQGTYLRAAPRSGLALKFGIDVLAGVVDCDYTGEIGIILLNTGTQDFEVKHGERIAQIIPEKIVYSQDDLVTVKELPPTARSGGGYGSSGK